MIQPASVPVLDFTNQFTTSFSLANSPPLVTAGEKLDIVLITTDPNSYEWDNSGYFNSNPYPNGTAIYSSDDFTWNVQTDWDFGFQTWVTPVPEPSALVPMGVLIFAIASRLRKFFA